MPGHLPSNGLLPVHQSATDAGITMLVVLSLGIVLTALLCVFCKICERNKNERTAQQKQPITSQLSVTAAHKDTSQSPPAPPPDVNGNTQVFSVMPRDCIKSDDVTVPLLNSDWMMESMLAARYDHQTNVSSVPDFSYGPALLGFPQTRIENDDKSYIIE